MDALICDLCRRQTKIYVSRGNIFQSAGVTFEARKTETRRLLFRKLTLVGRTSDGRAHRTVHGFDWRPGRRSADCETIIPVRRSHPLFFAIFLADPHIANKHTYTELAFVYVCMQTRSREWLIEISALGAQRPSQFAFIAYKYLTIWGQINHAEINPVTT